MTRRSRTRSRRLRPGVFLVAAVPVLGQPAPAFAQDPPAPGTRPSPAAQAEAGEASVLVARAVALQQQGDVQGAVAAYEQAFRLGADSPALRSNLGAAYARLGRYDDAIDQYKQALAREGTNAAIRRNLALAYYKTGRMQEAAAEAEAIVKAEPGNEAALLLLAECLSRLGQNAHVIELLQPLAGRSSQDRAVSYLLGMAFLAENRMAEAQSAIDRVLRDDSPEAHVFLAAMYMRDDDCDKALPEIKRVLDANPTLPLVNFLNGRCLMGDPRNDWEGAIAAFRAELANDPNHFESNLYLGDLLRERARHDEALPLLERALRLRPDSPGARFSLGALYVALDRTQEALPLLESVAAVAPGHIDTHMQLAIVYHRLGREADAAREKQQVARLLQEGENRFFKGVSDALARLLKSPGGTPTPPRERAKP